MDQSHADAITKAILEPDLKAREGLAHKRTQETAKLATQRRHAWFVLIGFAVGAAIGHFVLGRIVPYGLIGAFVGVLVSGLAGLLQTRTEA